MRSLSTRSLWAAILYALGGLLWILLSDRILLGLAPELASFAEFSLYKGFFFVLVSAGLFYFLLESVGGARSADGAGRPPARLVAETLGLFAVLVAVIAVVSLGLVLRRYRDEEAVARQRLMTIASLKTRELEGWLQERRGDITVMQRAIAFTTLLDRWLLLGDVAAVERLRQRLEDHRAAWGYQSAVLLAGDGTVLAEAGEPGHAGEPQVRALAREALRLNQLHIGEVYQSSLGGVPHLHLDFAAPLFGQDGRSSGRAIVLRVDMERFLLPLLRSWPLPSASGGAVLICRDGPTLSVLSPFAERSGAVSPAGSLESRALDAGEGLLAGDDLRGETVWMVPRQVGALDLGGRWVLVARVDKTEALEGFRTWLTQVAIGASLAFLAAAAAVSSMLRYRQVASLRREFDILEEKKSLSDRYSWLSKYANDAFLLAELDGRIIEVNERACLIYGRSRAELLGSVLSDLGSSQDRDDCGDLRKYFDGQDTVLFEAEHRRADGTLFPVEVSAKLFEVGGRQLYQAVVRDVTERKRSEETLRESALRLQTAVEGGNVGLWDWDLENDKVHYSPEYKRQLGYADDEIGDGFDEWRSRVHPDDLERCLETVGKYLAQPWPDYRLEFRLRHRDGSYRWFLAQASLDTDAAGKPRRMLGCHVDITEQKATEARLRRLNRTHALRSAVSQAILRQRDPADVFKAVCRIAVEVGGFRLAWIGLLDEDTGEVRVVAQAGEDNGYLDSLRIAVGEGPRAQGPTAQAIVQRRHMVSYDIEVDPEMAPWRSDALRHGFRSSAAFPLLGGGRALGVLNLYASEPDFFIPDELKLLDELALEISFVMELQEEERRRLEVEDEKRITELRYRALFENMSAGCALLEVLGEGGEEQEYVYLDVNQAFEKLTGLTGLVGRRVAESLSDARTTNIDLFEMFRRVRESGSSERMEAYFPGLDQWFSVAAYRPEPGHLAMILENITERKILERQLQERERLLSETQRLTKTGGWEYEVATGKGKWTDEVARIHEVDPSVDAGVEFGLSFFRGRDRETIEQAFQRAVELGQPYDLELEMTAANGAQKWVRATAAPVKEGDRVVRIRGSFQDITEKKTRERALIESEERFRMAFEGSASGMCITSLKGILERVNANFCTMLGHSREELEGRHYDSITWPSDSKVGSKAVRDLLVGAAEKVSFEKRYVTKAGSPIWAEINSALVRDAAGTPLHFITQVLDISDRKNAEREIKDLNEQLRRHAAGLERRVAERTEELNAAKERAESADRLKSVFLATMSHELRTPLNSIIGFTGTLLQGLGGPLNPEQEKQLTMVMGSGRHLLSLINDVLDISKIEAGEIVVSIEPFSARSSLSHVVESLSTLAHKAGVEMIVEFHLRDDEIVGDRRRTEQILTNLIGNAIKFTPSGGRVRAVVSLVDGEGDSARQKLSFLVEDSGIGILREDLARIFEPFQQIDSGTTRRFEGTGLGLSICQRLANLLGGRIEAHSEGLGRGSRFTVTLPRVQQKRGEELT